MVGPQRDEGRLRIVRQPRPPEPFRGEPVTGRLRDRLHGSARHRLSTNGAAERAADIGKGSARKSGTRAGTLTRSTTMPVIYRGPRPYSELDEKNFFGRDREIDDLFEL